MSMEESISLEETNKIRVSLGLKPLTEDGPPADNADKQAEDNYAKLREREAKERETKKIQDRIAKVRNRRELNASLKGATLGDADDADEDTLKWIKKAKKREKELAKKRMQELENMDKAFQGEEYTERDLEGLKVSHDFEDLGDGDARILTLKDSRILDDEEDELQNVEMARDEKDKKNRELKIKKRDYTGYDDEEFVPGAEGTRRAVLAKYDEDINGTEETGFRLGSSNIPSAAATKQKKEEAATAVNKSLLSIDYEKVFISSDYLQEGDVGFKKPKTKKKRPSRRVAEAETNNEAMEVDEKAIIPRQRDLDTNFVDDDDLQAALNRSRQAKLRKSQKLSPEELAKRVAEQRLKEEELSRQAIDVDADDDGEQGKGLTFDDTTEFVRAISYNPKVVKKEPTESDATNPASHSAPPIRDVSMAPPGDEPLEELEAGEVRVKEEDDEEPDMEMLDAIEEALKAEDAANTADDDLAAVGTSEEQTFSTGMAATLNVLRKQGILATPSADQQEREKTQLQRDLWLAEQRQRVALREMERLAARGANKDQATREYENRLREQQEARENLDAFKNYKPDVNIVYYDEFGRTLTPKEAWKALSHKFHGKGSGKMKTEKKLKKIAEEKKMEAMQSGDTPLSMQKAFQMRQEKAGQAHFVLSVGNRGAVPQASEFLDAQPLSKGKTEKKRKKDLNKGGAPSSLTQTLDSGFITLPAPPQQSSAIVSSNGGTPVMGSPAPRPGFSRIASSAVDSPASGVATPEQRSKVAFGFGTKRKATEELRESPAPKKR